jgi:hypothetical protein
LYAIFVRVVAGTFASAKVVSLLMEATVPIWIFPVVRRILPTLNSVKNAVPVPTTFEFPAVTVIVPERCVFGQAVASQVPVATLVMFKLTAPAGLAGTAENNIIPTMNAAATLYRKFFVFMSLLTRDRNQGMDTLPAK